MTMLRELWRLLRGTEILDNGELTRKKMDQRKTENGELMKTILLVMASNYTYPQESAVQLAGKSHKPIGVLSIASYLAAKGFRVKCIDQVIDDPKHYISNNQNDILFCGISSMSANYQAATDLLKFTKKINPNLTCIIGGAHPSANPEQVIIDGFDIAVMGEGETICEELARIFTEINDKDTRLAHLEKVQSISYQNKNNTVSINTRQNFISNLDDLPIIDRSLLPSGKYSPTQVTVSTSRGCPGRCIYCQSGPNFFGSRIRQRSPKNVVSEIKGLADQGVTFITFLDDCLLWDEHWVHQFCNIIKEERLKFLWVCETRAQYVTESTIKKIIEAGCRGLNIGFESGSDKILRFFRKAANTKIYRKSVDVLHRYGLSFHSYIIIGSPQETREDLQLTVDFVRKARPTQICVSHLTPIHGSELFANLSAAGLIRDVNQQVFYNNKFPIQFEYLTEQDLDHYEVEIYKAMYVPGKIPGLLKGDAFLFDDPIPLYVVGSQEYSGLIRVRNNSNFNWIAYPGQEPIPIDQVANKINRDNFLQQIDGKRVMLKIDWFDKDQNLIHSDTNGHLVGNVPINKFGTFVFKYTVPGGYAEVFFEYNLFLPDDGIIMSDIGFKPFRRAKLLSFLEGNKHNTQ
jgi:radical SAM superfamily enzyme YgiQ (UPF0313 family)